MRRKILLHQPASMGKTLLSLLSILIVFSARANDVTNQKIMSNFSMTWHKAYQEKVYLHTDKPYYSAGEDIWFKAYLMNASTHRADTKSAFVYVELFNQRDSLISRVKIGKDSTGFHGHLLLDSHMKQGNYYLRAYTYWMANLPGDFFFHKNIFIGNTLYEQAVHAPAPRGTDYSVKFFPESGTFLDSRLQTIAFKAIGENGLSTGVEGIILNQSNDTLVEFKSFHRGMGKLYLNTQPGESYFALVKSLDGIEKRFELPKTENKGVALKIFQNRGRVQFEIMNHSDLSIDSFSLMVHSRGFVKFVLPLHDSIGSFNENVLSEGINSFSIIDRQGRMYCERLCFSRNFAKDLMLINSDKDRYQTREKVKLDFQVINSGGEPGVGEYSLSVTDRNQVILDSLQDNIISFLTLSSDIKGYVEAPNEYFADNGPLSREKTDILMLTQGWKRFSTAEILQGKFPHNRFDLEAGQYISGKVLNLFNRPVANSEIILFSGYKNQISTAKTDSTGTFVLDGISFPDSTNIVLKAKSKSKIVDVGIEPDKEYFPGAGHFYPDLSSHKLKYPDEYFYQQKSKYIADGGLLTVDLDELTVKAEKKRKSTKTFYYSGQADNVFDSKRLEDFVGVGILNVISMFPGVQVNGENISVRGASGNPLFVVDGVETDHIEDILYLNDMDIEEIALFKGVSTSIFGSRGGNGVITISLKEGADMQREAPPSLAIVKPLGFQKPVEFYVPDYEVDSIYRQKKTDYRTTIYWNPSLVPDKEGKMHVEFFTADKPGDYQAEIEGLSNKGNITHELKIIKRTGETVINDTRLTKRATPETSTAVNHQNSAGN